MLGRKTYEPHEIDTAEALVGAALAAFEPASGAALVLALDRPFVHRVRTVGGKDTNPLNEVELLADSVMAGDGVFHTSKVIKWVPESSVLGLADGDPIALDAEQLTRLAAAFFAELRARCLA